MLTCCLAKIQQWEILKSLVVILVITAVSEQQYWLIDTKEKHPQQ